MKNNDPLPSLCAALIAVSASLLTPGPIQADPITYQPLPQVHLDVKGFVPSHHFDIHDANYVVSDGTNYAILDKMCFLSLGKMKEKIGVNDESHLVIIQAPWPGAVYKTPKEFLQINDRDGQLTAIRGVTPVPREPEIDVQESDVTEALKKKVPVVVIDEVGDPAPMVKIIKPAPVPGATTNDTEGTESVSGAPTPPPAPPATPSTNSTTPAPTTVVTHNIDD